MTTETPPVLSERHRQILALVAEGLTDVEIGARLYITGDTVKTHLSQKVYPRLGARNRSHAVALGYQTGLLGTAPPITPTDLDQVRQIQRLADDLQAAQHRAKYLEEQLAVALVENAAMRRDLRVQGSAVA